MDFGTVKWAFDENRYDTRGQQLLILISGDVKSSPWLGRVEDMWIQCFWEPITAQQLVVNSSYTDDF